MHNSYTSCNPVVWGMQAHLGTAEILESSKLEHRTNVGIWLERSNQALEGRDLHCRLSQVGFKMMEQPGQRYI